MRLLTPTECMIVKLIDPDAYNTMTKIQEDSIIKYKFLGLTTENFSRGNPLDDTRGYGIDTQFGNIIGVYTYESYKRSTNSHLYWVGISAPNTKRYLMTMMFTTLERRTEYLNRAQPFTDSLFYSY